MLKRFSGMILAGLLVASMTACSGNQNDSSVASPTVGTTASASADNSQKETKTENKSDSDGVVATANTTANGAIDTANLFTERDLTQTADTTDAKTYTVKDGEAINITAAGVYVLTGTASNVTVNVEAGDSDKVQLVLDNLSLTNSSAPAIYVKNADKVFVTTAKDSENSLTVSGSFTADGETNTDAVIFSKDDLVLNGLGTLTVSSTANGVSCKDDLKVTGGTLNITCAADALEANDSVAIADGKITINSQKDGVHAENDEDNAVGYVYICGGTLDITAASDGIHATTVAQVDDGTITTGAAEGIEATYVQINGGTITIEASDDGINGSNKSNAYSVKVEINGGDVTINMGQGDTDGIDSNGDLIINGGTIRITGQSACDCDGTAEKNGGTLIVNGEETDTIPNQMMGGGMRGGMQGGNMPGGDMPNDMQGGFPG